VGEETIKEDTRHPGLLQQGVEGRGRGVISGKVVTIEHQPLRRHFEISAPLNVTNHPQLLQTTFDQEINKDVTERIGDACREEPEKQLNEIGKVVIGNSRVSEGLSIIHHHIA
jgi:hypothetical protein